MASREVTTSVTIATTDIGFIIEANNTSTDTLFIYVPDNATVPVSDQDEIKILRSGSGPVTVVVTGASVFLNGTEAGSATLLKQYGLANLIKVDTNSWAIAGDVVSEIDTSLDIFNANIPALTDFANIQTAFYNYHYGQPNIVTDFNNLGEGSVAKYLYVLNQKVDAAEIGELVFTAIGPTQSLNTITTAAGFYYSPDVVTSSAVGEYFYPEAKPGILSAYKNLSGGFTQTYQTFTTVTGTTPTDNVWMRSTLYNNSDTWGQWSKLAKGDLDNYYTKTEIDNKTLNDLSGVIVTTPTNGQTLTYNGSNWVNQTPAGLSGYSFFSRTVLTTTGIVNLSTTGSIRAANIIAVGGGGGGGGVSGGGSAGPTQPAMSGAGGGGTYVQTFVTLASTTTGLGVTVGAGGNGGSSSTKGSAGGTTTVRISTTGSTIASAPGGSGGSAKSGRGIANGGAGGSAGSFTGTGISIPGGLGGAGTINLYSDAGVDTTDAVKAIGGTSMLSPNSLTDDTASGIAGAIYGGGGSGTWTTSSSGTNTGGKGAAGIVIIDLYV